LVPPAAAAAVPPAAPPETGSLPAAAPSPDDRPFTELLAKARAFERSGSLLKAHHAARAAQRLHPRSAEVLALLSQLALDEGNADQAAALAKRALLADQRSAEAYLVLGTVEQARAHTAKARAYFKRYLELAPSGDRARDVRAVLRMAR
jgi:tetratricopeptide (TPR) repeat protein